MAYGQLVAWSWHRWRASAAERRAYGGPTVTRFVLRPKGADPNDSRLWRWFNGFGPTPGERRTWAINAALPYFEAHPDLLAPCTCNGCLVSKRGG